MVWKIGLIFDLSEEISISLFICLKKRSIDLYSG